MIAIIVKLRFVKVSLGLFGIFDNQNSGLGAILALNTPEPSQPHLSQLSPIGFASICLKIFLALLSWSLNYLSASKYDVTDKSNSVKKRIKL